ALTPLPECVTLRTVRISREPVTANDVASAGPAVKQPGESEGPKPTPVERDLKRLREDGSKFETALVLSGITTDTSALQHYLLALGEAKLFAKADLTSMEANHSERQGTWKFSARLAVRPGYGLTGGPEGPEKPQSK